MTTLPERMRNGYGQRGGRDVRMTFSLLGQPNAAVWFHTQADPRRLAFRENA
jgi:hypothetical protein